MSEQLVSWENIQEHFEDKGASLLLGKAFSCAVWNDFKDTFLYKKASSGNNGGISLSAEDIKIFKDLGTENFEKVLAILSRTKEVVNEILGTQAHPPILQTIDERYQNIQRSLVQSVKEVHIPGDKFTSPDENEATLAAVKKNKNVLTAVKKEILKYPGGVTTRLKPRVRKD